MSLSTGSMLDAIAPELQEFERRLRETVHDDIGPMSEAMEHIVHAGGKRLQAQLGVRVGRCGDDHRLRPRLLHELVEGLERRAARRGRPAGTLIGR